jgi:hypothetical protein
MAALAASPPQLGPVPDPQTPAEDFMFRALLSLLKDEAEVILGGNDSESLLQVLGIGEGDAGMDMVASLVVPDGETSRSILDCRGTDAAGLALEYLRQRPTDAVLVRRGDDRYEPVFLRGGDGEDDARGGAEATWFHAPMTLAAARDAQRFRFCGLRVEVPRPQQTHGPPALTGS